jgi:hypothetical protein
MIMIAKGSVKRPVRKAASPAYLFKIQRIQKQKATERGEGTQGQNRRTAKGTL